MIWDLPNLLVCLALICAAYLLGKIKLSHALCLSLISFTPYCLNNVLFPASYMPDQFSYWHMLYTIRDFSYNTNLYHTRVTEASFMYAFLPLPFIETVNSLGFFNKFLMIVIFIWASSVLKLRGWVLWFLMLYPSLILYSSLGLRDMIICTLMLLALWSLMRGWYLFTLIFIGLLVQIKMQNALIVSLFAMCYVSDRYSHFNFNRKKLMLLMLILFALSYLVFPFIVEKIEYYRLRMFLEDGGLVSEYNPINGYFDFLSKGILSIFKALFYPLPWAAKGIFQWVQSIENICIALVLGVFTFNSYKLIPKQTVMWLLFLLSSMLMYGLVVSNVGTIVRYKLPFIVVYVILLSYEQVRFKKEFASTVST